MPRLALILAILASAAAVVLDVTGRAHAVGALGCAVALIAYACSERV